MSDYVASLKELKALRKELEEKLTELVAPHLEQFKEATGVGVCGLFGNINVVMEHGSEEHKLIFHGFTVQLDIEL